MWGNCPRMLDAGWGLGLLNVPLAVLARNPWYHMLDATLGCAYRGVRVFIQPVVWNSHIGEWLPLNNMN